MGTDFALFVPIIRKVCVFQGCNAELFALYLCHVLLSLRLLLSGVVSSKKWDLNGEFITSTGSSVWTYAFTLQYCLAIRTMFITDRWAGFEGWIEQVTGNLLTWSIYPFNAVLQYTCHVIFVTIMLAGFEGWMNHLPRLFCWADSFTLSTLSCNTHIAFYLSLTHEQDSKGKWFSSFTFVPVEMNHHPFNAVSCQSTQHETHIKLTSVIRSQLG